jgi:hypothetical protein
MLADALSRLYEDIPRDRIGTEEMADGINNEDDNVSRGWPGHKRSVCFN